MNIHRRDVLRQGGVTLLALVAAAGWLKPGEALAADAWNKAAFDTNSMDATLKALGGGTPVQSKDVTFFQTPRGSALPEFTPCSVVQLPVAIAPRYPSPVLNR